ncbi:DUF6455 family protein [Microvirga terrae]|uniref:DUF6455 family protein n=1 Tax=Microvirga terrae TaxID=2740529 RepID=A0ABY5RVX9_9HYPH|nr:MULTISPECIES: DUF6455 family protein [Microvirga]MBQ0819622.1 hypothetical protein [Microvirga sp. HBU67558]UVF21400.1 DUF6455 family protein [Microvirga terrae]
MDPGAAIKRWRETWRQRHELESLDRDQRDALARDIGVSADMLPLLAARDPGAAEELPRLMEALSLDPDRIRRIHSALMRDMSLTCSGCTAAVRCRQDLEHERAPAHYAAYCPNAGTLLDLQEEAAPESARP